MLLAIVAGLLWRERPAAPVFADPAARSAAGPAGTPPRGEAAPEPSRSAAGPRTTRAAMAQLEQMGFPRDLLAGVVLEDLNRRTTRRLLELQKKYAPKPVPERELRELARQGNVEQVRELKEALGEPGYLAWDKAQTLRALNRARVPGDELPMTADEAEHAYRLQKAFDDKYQGLQEAMEDGFADRADVGQLQAQAQQDLDRELERLLGKQRFDELRGNADPTTEVYRTYGDLNPTSDQAKAVVLAEADYRARQADLARRLQETPGDPGKVAAELKALGAAQDENLRRIFGAEAYEAVKRQNDPTYQTLQQYAGAWELNDAEVQSVYQALHALHDQTDRTRSAAAMSEAAGHPVNWPETNAAIEQARQQAEAGLLAQIGAERLRRLKQNGLLDGGG